MALTPEEELELKQLEEQLPSIMSDYEDLKKQLTPKAEGVETGMIESLARGAAQGLTFENADEIAAALSGVGGLVTGEGFGKAYEKGLEESRAEYAAAEEEYPVASTVGQIAGGIGQGLALSAVPGASAASASKSLTAANRLKNLLLPSVSKGAGKNIASAITSGAAAGALTELGASEDKKLSDLGSGALSGAAVGGVLGAGIEGVKGIAGSIGKRISKGIDEGEYPEIFKQARTALRTGAEGQGFTTPKDKQMLIDEAKSVAKDFVPQISEELKKVGNLRQKILENTEGVYIPVEKSIQALMDDLKTNPYKKANSIRKQIQKIYIDKRMSLQGTPFTPAAASSLASDIEELMRTNKDVNKSILNVGYSTAKAIDDAVNMSIDTKTALSALAKDPEALADYSKYVQTLTPDELLGKPLKKGKKLSADVAQQKADELVQVLKDVSSMVGSEDPAIIDDLLKKTDPDLVSNLNPIRKLNDQMRKALSARGILGVKKGLNFDEKKYKDFEKIFQNILDQGKDTKSSLIKKERYEAAMTNLKESFPELAKQIDERVQPVVDKLQLKSYMETGSLDASGEKSGIIKSAIGNLGQLGVSGLNLAAQTTAAANKGIRGPFKLGSSVPTSTMLRPSVSTLTSLKNSVDEIVELRKFKGGDPGVFKMISERLDDALKEKDEARRAAIINTLMQYSFFRNILNGGEDNNK
jgi:hypothetical protein